MLIALLVFLGLSFLILAHEAGHFFMGKLFGLKVEEFGFGFPPRMFAKKFGETEYSINWLPFGGFVKIAGENDAFDEEAGKHAAKPTGEQKRYFVFQPAWKRSVVVLAGVTVNFLLGWLLLSGILMAGTPPLVVISGVAPDSPAQQAGLREGDIIKDYRDVQSFISFVNENKGKEISLTLLRQDGEVTVTTTPRSVLEENQGPLGVVLSDAGVPKQGFFKALYVGFIEAWRICWLTLVGFYQLIKTLVVDASLTPGVVGPVGIFTVAQQTGSLGFIYLVQLLSLISLNLAVVNLIPFPALDGGRFFLIMIEKIKGSPIPRRLEGYVNAFGFAFLLLLMVLLTFRDVASRWF